MHKYQSVAPQRVIQAVERAAARTGADFSFLMDKASAESGFDPSATSKSSTATGLFQFIDSTWLNMMKEHGAKYGLGALASQIQIRNGKPCVDDCKAKAAILNLRKNPEIAALMAGEFSAQNKQYLQEHTDGTVGATELYFAHFMGATGATKFLNARDAGGDAVAADLFPKEALANRNVFFDPATGRARTLDGIYDFFAQKFGGGNAAADAKKALSPPAPPQTATALASADIAQTFSSPDGWSVPSMSGTGFSHISYPALHRSPMSKLSAESILLMAQMQMLLLPPAGEKHRENAGLS
ncbi:MAG: transglycosylase SLT domain-containing protein [Pseudomonadota bacterium]